MAERKEGKERKKESAPVNLKQASVSTCASSTAGDEMALIFYGETGSEQSKQGSAEHRGKLGCEGKGVHGWKDLGARRGNRFPYAVDRRLSAQAAQAATG